MKATSTALGDVGMSVTRCDNPKCRKACPVVWRGRNGEYCSNKCLKAVEYPKESGMFAEDDDAVAEETETETASAEEAQPETPAVKKAATKKSNKKEGKEVKNAKKAPAKKAAAKKAKGNGSARLNGESKITVIGKDHEFRGKRAKKFALLKTGMTVESAVEAMKKAKLPSPSGFLRVCEEMKLIKIA